MLRHNHSIARKRVPSGLTFIEVVVAIAVIGILALVLVPNVMCRLSVSRMSSQVSDMDFARGLIETHKAETGKFPGDLQEAFGDSYVPDHLIYCVDDPDANNGHGNEFCTFFDWSNPGGSPPQSAKYAGFLLLTKSDLCPCKNIDYFWLSCCGMEPDEVQYGEEDGAPGHPGHGV